MSKKDFSPQEIAAVRAATPGCSQVVHFNNAGASLMPEIVANTAIDYLRHELHYGGYETAEKLAAQIDFTYQQLAAYLNCDPSEIALMENATAAWQQAFLSIPFEPGDSILTTFTEYASNYIPFLQLQKKMGVSIKPIPYDHLGQVDLKALRRMADDTVKLISITHVPTNSGLVNPVVEIGEIAREMGAVYLLDACQSVGQMPLDVKQIGCNFLSATSRKFLRGPRGVGFLYAANDSTAAFEPAILDLHGAHWESGSSYVVRDDARKYENWEFNLAGVAGLGVAVQYMLDLGIDRIWQRVRSLSDLLRTSLSGVDSIRVQDPGDIKCGIVSFSGPFDADHLKSMLQQKGFNVSVIRPTHTLLDMKDRKLGRMIRASVHYYNTEKEIERFVKQVEVMIH